MKALTEVLTGLKLLKVLTLFMLGGWGEGGLEKIPICKLSINQPMNLEIKFYFKMYILSFLLCSKAELQGVTISKVTQNMTKK